jgi:hypothetical protein
VTMLLQIVNVWYSVRAGAQGQLKAAGLVTTAADAVI